MSNIVGDVLEELKDTAGKAASQVNPWDFVEAGAAQMTGKQGQKTDQTAQKQWQKQMQQMKVQDDQNKNSQLAQIRQNLAQMMQPKAKPQTELPKNISGAVGAPKTLAELEKRQDLFAKQKKKLPELPISAKGHQGSAEGGIRGVSG